MSLLRSALERRSIVDVLPSSPAVPTHPDGYGNPAFGSWGTGMTWQTGSSSVGIATVDSAMRLSAVFACLRVLSDPIATLPLDTFRRELGARLPYRPRPDYLNFGPSQGSKVEYLSSVMLSLLTDGNAFVATPRNDMGEPVTLVPLDPSRVSVERRQGQVVYVVASQTFTSYDIMHIKGMAFPGALRGVSPIAAARDVIAGAAKAQDFGVSLFDNAAVPPAVIEVPEGPTPGNDAERAKRIATTWNETHGGTSNAGKVGVLIGGAKLSTVAVTPEDAQWLDTRRFGVQEIARIFGVPPHLIADSSNSTSWGSGLAEQNLAFGQFSLRPWIERIEDAHNRLLTSHGLPEVFMKLNLDALLRASLADRYASYSQAIAAGFMSPNEARALEDMPPVSGGDQITRGGGQ